MSNYISHKDTPAGTKTANGTYVYSEQYKLANWPSYREAREKAANAAKPVVNKVGQMASSLASTLKSALGTGKSSGNVKTWDDAGKSSGNVKTWDDAGKSSGNVKTWDDAGKSSGNVKTWDDAGKSSENIIHPDPDSVGGWRWIQKWEENDKANQNHARRAQEYKGLYGTRTNASNSSTKAATVKESRLDDVKGNYTSGPSNEAIAEKQAASKNKLAADTPKENGIKARHDAAKANAEAAKQEVKDTTDAYDAYLKYKYGKTPDVIDLVKAKKLDNSNNDENNATEKISRALANGTDTEDYISKLLDSYEMSDLEKKGEEIYKEKEAIEKAKDDAAKAEAAENKRIADEKAAKAEEERLKKVHEQSALAAQIDKENYDFDKKTEEEAAAATAKRYGGTYGPILKDYDTLKGKVARGEATVSDKDLLDAIEAYLKEKNQL